MSNFEPDLEIGTNPCVKCNTQVINQSFNFKPDAEAGMEPDVYAKQVI